jgi:hypothetical protein
MAATPTTYRGNNTSIWISGVAHSSYALSDFTLTLAKGVSEQELLGEEGNYFLAGSMSIDGSATACRLTTTGLGVLVDALVSATPVKISGNFGTNSLHFYFRSCQVTSFDFTLGDADTISEGSFDFSLLYPYLVSSVQYRVGGTGAVISDGPL